MADKSDTLMDAPWPAAPVPANLFAPYKAAVDQYRTLSESQQSRLIDMLGLRREHERQIREDLSQGFSTDSVRQYGATTRVVGVLAGLASGALTFLGVKNKPGWLLPKKILSTVGLGAVGALAGLLLTSRALRPLKEVALHDAMDTAFQQGNEKFLKLLAERILERPEALAAIQGAGPLSERRAWRSSHRTAGSHVAAAASADDVGERSR